MVPRRAAADAAPAGAAGFTAAFLLLVLALPQGDGSLRALPVLLLLAASRRWPRSPLVARPATSPRPARRTGRPSPGISPRLSLSRRSRRRRPMTHLHYVSAPVRGCLLAGVPLAHAFRRGLVRGTVLFFFLGRSPATPPPRAAVRRRHSPACQAPKLAGPTRPITVTTCPRSLPRRAAGARGIGGVLQSGAALGLFPPLAANRNRGRERLSR